MHNSLCNLQIHEFVSHAASIELRNEISAATGVALPGTLAFDYPTAAAIAKFVGQQSFTKMHVGAVILPRCALL